MSAEDVRFWLNLTAAYDIPLGDDIPDPMDYLSDDPVALEYSALNCTPPQIHRLTDSELEALDFVRLYVERVALVAVSTVGIICNSVSIPVLLSRKMTNLFNRTLAMLG